VCSVACVESGDIANDLWQRGANLAGELKGENMTLEELKAKYTVAYRIITRERAMRDKVFATNEEKRQEKMAEMDRLLEIVDDLKDEIKRRIGSQPEQPTLLDAVKEFRYE